MSDSVSLTKTKAPGLKPTLSTYLAPATLDSPVVMLYDRSPQPAHSPCLRHAANGMAKQIRVHKVTGAHTDTTLIHCEWNRAQ